jgi:hypothetical protein
MQRPMRHTAFLSLAPIAAAFWAAPIAVAQVPGNYGEYYRQQTASYGVSAGLQSPNRYLYDKYFYHNPAVSPYMNVFRPDTDRGTAYQSYVRPELQRRETAARSTSAAIQQRKIDNNLGGTRYPSAGYGSGMTGSPYVKPAPAAATPSHYHNHWYGGWANR